MGVRFFLGATLAAVASAVALPAGPGWANTSPSAVRSLPRITVPIVVRQAPVDPCYWQVTEWSDLSPREQVLLGRLGWNARSWGSDDASLFPASDTRYWSELTPSERAINEALGQTEQSWDNPPQDCDGRL